MDSLTTYDYIQKKTHELKEFSHGVVKNVIEYFYGHQKTEYERVTSEISKAYVDYMQKINNFVCYVTKDEFWGKEVAQTYPTADSQCIMKKGEALGELFSQKYDSGIVVAIGHVDATNTKVVLQVEIENNNSYKNIDDYYSSVKTEGYSQCEGPDAIRSFVRYFHLTEEQWQECSGVVNSDASEL